MNDFIGELQDLRHLSYQLIFAKICIDEQDIEGYISRSVNFRKENEKKAVFDTYYELYREKGESPLAFAIRYGWAGTGFARGAFGKNLGDALGEVEEIC